MRRIEYIDFYFARDKKDVFALQLTPAKGKILGGYDEDTLKEHFEWLDSHNITHALICSLGHMVGDTGTYYLGFDGWDDPKIKEYSAKYENAEGTSLNPDKYKLVVFFYQQWLDKGGPAEYEQHLKNLADPNYEP